MGPRPLERSRPILHKKGDQDLKFKAIGPLLTDAENLRTNIDRFSNHVAAIRSRQNLLVASLDERRMIEGKVILIIDI